MFLHASVVPSREQSSTQAERRHRDGADHPELHLARPCAAIGRHALCGHRTDACDRDSRRHQGLELVPHCQLTMRILMSEKIGRSQWLFVTCSHPGRYGSWQWLCASVVGRSRCAPADFLSVALSLSLESHRLHHHTAAAVTQIERCRCFVRWFIGISMQPATNHTTLVLNTTSGATETSWISDSGPH